MNFTIDMIEKLTPEERLILSALFEKAQDARPSASAPEWPWTMKGPASEEQALKARKGALSPRLTGGKGLKAVSPLAALTSTAQRV